MSQPAIRVERLAKRYRIGQTVRYELFSERLLGVLRSPWRLVSRLARRRSEKPTIWALDDVSFEVGRGEVVGIVGANGAGKSTLLKVLSRITPPTRGRVRLLGRAGSLLEVGTGFHAELTGRENIYLNGAIMGMKRAETARRFDQIVEFAGIEPFVDTPVKRYSSGMYVRLAFAVAAHLEPEILLVDEVLAVGDASFQRKCLGTMDRVAREGRTILLVSHNSGSIRQLCPRCIWVDRGRIRQDGDAAPVLDAYLAEAGFTGSRPFSEYPEDESKAVQIRSARLVNQSGEPAQSFSCDEPVGIELRYQVRRPLKGVYGCFQVMRGDGMPVLLSYSNDTVPNPLDADLSPGHYRIRLSIPARTLGHGRYSIQLSLGHGWKGTTIVEECGTILAFTLDDFTSAKGNTRLGFLSTLLRWEVEPSAAGPEGPASRPSGETSL